VGPGVIVMTHTWPSKQLLDPQANVVVQLVVLDFHRPVPSHTAST
jgi:hypothetical protein